MDQNQTITLEGMAKKFVDDLVEAKGFVNIEPEVMEQIKSDLMSRLNDRMNGVIIEHMPPANMDEFEQLLDRDASDEELSSFCRQHIPELEAKLAVALMQFKQTYLNS